MVPLQVPSTEDLSIPELFGEYEPKRGQDLFEIICGMSNRTDIRRLNDDLVAQGSSRENIRFVLICGLLIKVIEGLTPTPGFKYKLVVAVRRDLEMGKGKIAVQVGHATITVSEQAKRERPDWWNHWFNEGQRKVVVKVSTESDLWKLKREAEALGLPSTVIQDSGLTQLEPGTATCIGIGPAPAELVDKITGELSLL